MMRILKRLSVVLLASASVIATPAAATDYLFDTNGDNYTIYFDGFTGNPSNPAIPGLTSNLYLNLVSGAGTGTWTFSYTLTNTSIGDHAGSAVTGYAFDSNPNVTGASATGDYGIKSSGPPPLSYPNGVGALEVCLTNGNTCQGSGGGATVGDPAMGTFTLQYGADIPSLILSDFFVRYQSTGPNQEGSANGRDTPPVPEPSTWAMMLFGFGALGFAMRRRRSKETLRVRYA